MSILLASLLSLFWLIRSGSLIERLLLSALFGTQHSCAANLFLPRLTSSLARSTSVADARHADCNKG